MQTIRVMSGGVDSDTLPNAVTMREENLYESPKARTWRRGGERTATRMEGLHTMASAVVESVQFRTAHHPLMFSAIMELEHATND